MDTTITLTQKQEEVRKYVAHGYASKEIAEQTGNSVNTINTHIRDIKIVRGLQKISEITADYWCELFGTSLEEQRKQIIAAVTCLLFCVHLGSYSYDIDKRRYRLRCRRENIEVVDIDCITA